MRPSNRIVERSMPSLLLQAVEDLANACPASGAEGIDADCRAYAFRGSITSNPASAHLSPELTNRL